MSRDLFCNECHISELGARRNIHPLLFMHRQKDCEKLLKTTNISTGLHKAPVFGTYKPNNEKARLNVFYRGAIAWNDLPAYERNMNFKDFKKVKTKSLLNH